MCQPECKYCHKLLINFGKKEFSSQDEADEYATENCDCESAKKYQNRKNDLKKLDFYIDNIENNFPDKKIIIDDETKKLLKTIGKHVLDSDCNVVYKMSPIKLSFGMNSKGKLIINLTITESNNTQI